MKILMLTQVLPYPPDSGPKIKTWNVIKYLAQRHDLVLVSFVRGQQSDAEDTIRDQGIEVHTVPIRRNRVEELRALLASVVNGRPVLIERDFRPAMRDLIFGLAKTHKFDLVHADQLNMAQYAHLVPDSTKLLDAHNALWMLYKRLSETMRPGPMKWILKRDWKLLRRYEGRVCREFDQVIAVSSQDRSWLLDAAEIPLNIAIIPITVDLEQYQTVFQTGTSSHILHLGTMYWPPNVEGVLWFLQQVWPLIRAKEPPVVFDVVGARPPDEILAIGRADRRVRVHGYVEDLAPILQKAGVMIVPVGAGSGMRVKILEGLARGIPIVTTSMGAEGIDVVSGKHLIVADTPSAFARGVLRLLDHSEEAARMAEQGRRLIAMEYDYLRVLPRLDEIYLDQEKRSSALVPGSIEKIEAQ